MLDKVKKRGTCKIEREGRVLPDDVIRAKVVEQLRHRVDFIEMSHPSKLDTLPWKELYEYITTKWGVGSMNSI